MNLKRTLTIGALASALSLTAVIAPTVTTNAQGGPAQGGPMLMMFGNPCSTTDYTDIAAKALGITATELRVALVSGKTLTDLATAKNVKIEDVNKAIADARQADLVQAQKDGLIETLPTLPDGTMPELPGMPNGPWFGGGDNMPGNGITIRIGGPLFGISPYNEVQYMNVAAQALGMSCVDLVKATREGDKSIVQVATEKNVSVQTVIDALVKAFNDASAQDVKEGLITQAQADGRNSRLVERVTMMISQPGGMMGHFEMRNFSFGGAGRGGRGDGNGPNAPRGPKNGPNQPSTPQPSATPQQ